MPNRRDLIAGAAALPFAPALGRATPAAPRPAPRPAPSPALSWASCAPLPIRTQEIYAAGHEGRVFVAGGLSPDADGPKAAGLGVTDRVFAYDPGADAWTEGPRLPGPRHHAHLVSHQGRLYAVGGFVVGEGAWTMTPSVLVLDGDA